ncbi:toxin-antitoxin system YwqK family antitoxin [Algibacter mikhailovii]|uniref:Toxin-antitoxin system YwqK family antitoxin n=1 Tax=Algibacter mikhailovii TaxID=425498 RepID=A0A918VA04_9FLAO|nr:hypothetical protein [Algibacter mikhailovii]GGZ82759.1 hypothetical protein GCM10007028_20750 [Algibacter mikhailovii]
MRFKVLHIVVLMGLLFGCNTSTNTVVVNDTYENLRLENGVLFYNTSPFNGVLRSSYASGAVKRQVNYRDGKKDGSEIQWSENGNKLIERYYAQGVKRGIHKAWWDHGILKFEYHFNDRGEYHGEMKEWYESGQPLRAFNYVNGKEDGAQRLWKPDGSIKANYEVVHGERFGLIGLKKCYTVTVNSDEVK